MLGNLKAAEVDVDYWIDTLNRGNVTIATDGLVAAQRGPCDGEQSMMSSYRTELAGVLSALYLLHALSDYLGINITTRQSLHCDNAAA
eukprot:13293813-Ditylum_brightwellii.AAC.1